jgi:hypothetical protein
MELGNYIDSIILIASGTLIGLYGVGKIFSRLAGQEAVGKEKMKVNVIVGLILVLAGAVQALRHLV